MRAFIRAELPVSTPEKATITFRGLLLRITKRLYMRQTIVRLYVTDADSTQSADDLLEVSVLCAEAFHATLTLLILGCSG